MEAEVEKGNWGWRVDREASEPGNTRVIREREIRVKREGGLVR